jgi:hypothetical protein
MSSAALRWALTGQPGLRGLPDRAVEVLLSVNAPPRLAAHLRLVHDVACSLAEAIAHDFATAEFDRDAVLFGAAIHDIGKTLYPAELSAPGACHEHGGYDLLIAHGVEEDLARFARTHASWHDPDIRFEDLLVSLADKVWKGKRVEDLEQLVVNHLVASCGGKAWEVFMTLDDILTSLAADADERLALQAAHPIADRPG